MKKTGIYYGSSTGTTEEIAGRIAKILGVSAEDIHNVANSAPDSVAEYQVLVMGTSTWGAGDLQPDWYDFVAGVQALDLRGKKIALFGCGDETMSDTFCSGVGELHDRLVATGADFIGEYDTDGYTFEKSAAVRDDNGKAVGLLLDEVNHPEMTDFRLRSWIGETF